VERPQPYFRTVAFQRPSNHARSSNPREPSGPRTHPNHHQPVHETEARTHPHQDETTLGHGNSMTQHLVVRPKRFPRSFLSFQCTSSKNALHSPHAHLRPNGPNPSRPHVSLPHSGQSCSIVPTTSTSVYDPYPTKATLSGRYYRESLYRIHTVSSDWLASKNFIGTSHSLSRPHGSGWILPHGRSSTFETVLLTSYL